MGLFDSKSEKVDPIATSLLSRINDLSTQLAKVEGKLAASEDTLELKATITTLKEEIAELEINKSRIEETNQRERREIEHKVGLEKKRQEQELALAKREAKLEAGEANLAADKARFEENVEFIKTETEGTRRLVTELLERLPKVNVELGSGNGSVG